MTAGGRFRDLPSIDRLLADERVRSLAGEYGAGALTQVAREHLADLRRLIASGRDCPPFDEIALGLANRAGATLVPSLRPVINATGVIIHTNLGRAPLSDEAIEAMAAVSRGYSNLEFDLPAGERGSRFAHLESLLCRLTGAEAAIAVNNNASAVLLALSALCAGREVVISRGQLIEIGGGFRIPDVMRQSGARLVEVGTTNRTYLRDYEEAIGEGTAALMRVHTSNFRITGFVDSPPLADLARLAHERGLLLIDDLGSGCLLDTRQFGLAPEPTPQESLAAGADLALFSGDKLLGGPQAGVVAGRRDLVAALRRHPLARAVRMDKASIAGLAATLTHYLKGEALEKVPVWRMIATPLGDIERRARRWVRALSPEANPPSAEGPAARLVEGRSMVGGGSLPEESLPTALVALGGEGVPDAETLARRLREGDPPVVARIERDRVVLDPRTVDPREDRVLVAAVKAALAG